MKNVFYLLLMTGLLMSCGGNSDKLNFSKFEISDESGVVGLKVNEAGEIIIGNEIAGKVGRDGKFMDNSAAVVASLTVDNILVDKKGKELVKIDENGKMDNGSGKFIEWSESGKFMRGNEDSGMKITPVEKASFQAASAVLFLYLSVGD